MSSNIFVHSSNDVLYYPLVFYNSFYCLASERCQHAHALGHWRRGEHPVFQSRHWEVPAARQQTDCRRRVYRLFRLSRTAVRHLSTPLASYEGRKGVHILFRRELQREHGMGEWKFCRQGEKHLFNFVLSICKPITSHSMFAHLIFLNITMNTFAET